MQVFYWDGLVTIIAKGVFTLNRARTKMSNEFGHSIHFTLKGEIVSVFTFRMILLISVSVFFFKFNPGLLVDGLRQRREQTLGFDLSKMCGASSDGTKSIGRLMKLDEIVRCDQYNL